jgi:hypothetical protein
MADKRLQDRRVRVLIANRVAEDYKSITADVTEIKDLRVQFSVKKQSTKEPNTAEVTITNLSPARRSALQTKGVKFVLECGYVDTGVKQIFQGDVRHVSHVREGADWRTVLKSGDGERAFQFARISESLGPKASKSDVIKRLSAKLGLGLGNSARAAASIPGSFEQGIVLSGPVSRELDKVLKGTGYEWSIQDEQLVILSASEVSGQDVPLLTPDSGLIGSPEFGAPLEKGGKPQLKFKALLNANIKPGAKVQIQCERFPIGVSVKCAKVEHSGDTAGQDWYTSVEGATL